MRYEFQKEEDIGLKTWRQIEIKIRKAKSLRKEII